MSGPASSPLPARGGLGPPPSLDGLTALLSHNQGGIQGQSSTNTNQNDMDRPPKPFSLSELASHEQIGSSSNSYIPRQPPQHASQPGSPASNPASTASARSSAASMSRAPLSSQRFSTISDSKRRDSAGSATARRSNGFVAQASSSTLSPNHPDNLRKQAKTYLDPSFSVKSYVGAANALLEKARSSDLQGQAEQAFVNYLKAADVATRLPKHADWPRIVEERGPTYLRYQDFMKNVPDIIQRGHRLEELLKAREEARAKEAANALQDQHVSGAPYVEQDLEGAEGGTDAVTDQQAAEGVPATPFDGLADRLGALRMGARDADSESTNQETSPKSHLEHRLDRLAHGDQSRAQGATDLRYPDSRRGSVGTPAQLASPRLEKSGFSGISDGAAIGPDLQPTYIPSASEFNKSFPTLNDFEARQSRPASPSRPLPVPPPFSAGPSKSTSVAKPIGRPPLPPPAKRDISVEDLFPMLFPGFDTIADPQLGQRIVRRSAPRVLLLDVRPRAEWERGHIKGVDVVCLDPSELQPGMNAIELGEVLSASLTAAERTTYEARNTYDLIIICDREGHAVTGPVEIVYRAISMDEARKSPSRSPTYLNGGVERWSRKVGEQGVQRLRASSSATETAIPVAGHTTRPPSLSLQNGDARTKRQGMYVANSTTPAALLPGHPAGKGRNGSFPTSSSMDMLDSPSMPARAYQTAGSGTFATSHLARQPAGPLTPSSSQSFDYPQLNGSQGARQPYTNGTLTMASAPTPPPAAAAGNGVARTPGYDGAQPTYDIARRPTVPPPGGAPVNIRQYSRVVPRVETNVRVGLTGLKNVGNSCYMNSTLQCLSATIPLARFLLDGSYKRAINRVNPLGTQGALAEAFAQLIRVMWSEQYTFVSPVTFREAITRFAPSFRGYEQHDAQEFLAFLLDGLHEDLNYVKQKPPPVEMTPDRENELEMLPQQIASVKEWAIYRERNDSLIVDWFQGQFRNKLTCLTCGKTSTTYNAFLYLSLPIPPVPRGSGNRVTLAQCLDAFTRDEILDKADAWHCPRCNKPRRATKKLTISRLPQVLLIHLKRFSFKGPFTDKIETNVTFPTSNLDLTNYMPPPLPPGTVPKGMPVSASQQPPYVYDLYGATHHFGSLSGGHYTATIRTHGDNGDTQWKYCDDSRITNYDERQIHSPSSYILWWNRKGR